MPGVDRFAEACSACPFEPAFLQLALQRNRHLLAAFGISANICFAIRSISFLLTRNLPTD
jgi:hypothetical protein